MLCVNSVKKLPLELLLPVSRVLMRGLFFLHLCNMDIVTSEGLNLAWLLPCGCPIYMRSFKCEQQEGKEDEGDAKYQCCCKLDFYAFY